jgi:hypothetical protein
VIGIGYEGAVKHPSLRRAPASIGSSCSIRPAPCGSLPTPGVVYAQQPGPINNGGVYPYRVTLEMIGGARQRQEVLSANRTGCLTPQVIQRPSEALDEGTWYVGTQEEASAARAPATSN